MYLFRDETWYGVWSVQLLEEGEQDGGAGQAIHLQPRAAGVVKLSAFVDFSCTSLVRAASSEIFGQELPDRLGLGDPHGAVHQQPGAGADPHHGPVSLHRPACVQCE